MIETRIQFFATPTDIESLLSAFEIKIDFDFKYVLTGRTLKESREVYTSFKDIPDKGISTHETGYFSTGYMILPLEDRLVINIGRQRSGDACWDLDTESHKNAVSFVMGGVWEENTLLAGEILYAWDTETGIKIVKALRAAFRSGKYKKIDGYLLGEDALNWLQRGKRLTRAAQSPRECDLRLDVL